MSRALADIKIMWAQVRNGIKDAVSGNERFSAEGRHYIRFVFRTDVCYWNILNRKSVPLPEKIQPGYEKVIADLGGENGMHVKNLNRYICSQMADILVMHHLSIGNQIKETDFYCGRRIGYNE